MSDQSIIAGAAQRIAMFCDAIVDAHDVHEVTPGDIGDLSSPEFCHAAKPILALTIAESYLHDLGVTFGGVSTLMETSVIFDEIIITPAWRAVEDFMRNAADEFAPDWVGQLPDRSTLLRVGNPTPPVARFDLIAGNVTNDAARTLRAAAREVITEVSRPRDDVVLGQIDLSSLPGDW